MPVRVAADLDRQGQALAVAVEDLLVWRQEQAAQVEPCAARCVPKAETALASAASMRGEGVPAHHRHAQPEVALASDVRPSRAEAHRRLLQVRMNDCPCWPSEVESPTHRVPLVRGCLPQM